MSAQAYRHAVFAHVLALSTPPSHGVALPSIGPGRRKTQLRISFQKKSVRKGVRACVGVHGRVWACARAHVILT